MKETKNITCHECSGLMVYETREDTIEYKGERVTVDLMGWWCSECNESILKGPEVVKFGNAFRALKARVDELMLPEDVKRIRKERLRLSQQEAGLLLGGGARSFQKYESGNVWVSKAMANLLRLLDNDPGRIKELQKRA